MKTKPVCLICNSPSKKIFMAFGSHGKQVGKERFEYLKCTVCNVLFFAGVKNVNSNFYKKYYSDTYYTVSKDSFLQNLYTRYTNYVKLKKIQAYAPKRSNLRILDVGSGDGKFINSLDTKKYARYSLDTKTIHKIHGVKQYNSDIFDFKTSQKFHVITLWHVIEHLKSPTKLLSKIESLLEPDGIAIISTPNTDSLGFKLSLQNWFHLDAPRHIVLFNEKSAKKLIEKSNLDLVSYSNFLFEFPLDLLWSFRSAKINYLLPFIPIIKVISSETKTWVLKKQ